MKITEQVLLDFLASDMQAFQKIYEATKKIVYNTIYKMIPRQQEAEDIMHDVYVKVYEKRALYKKDYSINTWINKVAVNHTINYIKRQNNLFNKLREVNFFYKQHLDEGHSQGDGLLELLERIDIKFRAPIVLKDIQGFSYEEVAQIMNLPVGTVRSRLNRGRKQLRELYETEVLNGKEL